MDKQIEEIKNQGNEANLDNDVNKPLLGQSHIPKKNAIIHAIILALIFVLLFTAFDSAENMISSIYDDMKKQGLGQTSLAVVYVVLAVNNLFVTSIYKRISFKTGLFFASFGYVLFLGSGIATTSCNKEPNYFFCSDASLYCLSIFTAFCCGFCAAML